MGQTGVEWRDAFRLGIGTLTRIPVRPPAKLTPRVAGRAMLTAPLVALLVVVPAVLLGRAATAIGLPSLAAALLVVGSLAWLTRAIHLDGLADTADGLGASWERERALAVMRRGDVGPMGAVTLIVTIGLQTALITPLLDDLHGTLLAAVALAASRAALAVTTMRGVPSARADGLGHSVAGTVSPVAATTQWLTVVVAMVGASSAVGRPWWAGLLGVVLALSLVASIVRTAVRRLGGITGDVLGATVELAAVGLLAGVSVG